MKGFFFLKLVLSTGRAIKNTLQKKMKRLTNGFLNLLIVNEFLVCSYWEKWIDSDLGTHLALSLKCLKFLVNHQRTDILLFKTLTNKVSKLGLSGLCIYLQ